MWSACGCSIKLRLRHVHAQMHTHTDRQTHTHTLAHTSTHTYRHTHTRAQKCARAHTHARKRTNTHTSARVHAHACTHRRAAGLAQHGRPGASFRSCTVRYSSTPRVPPKYRLSARGYRFRPPVRRCRVFRRRLRRFRAVPATVGLAQASRWWQHAAAAHTRHTMARGRARPAGNARARMCMLASVRVCHC